jgi:hypothetical protein
LGSVVPCSAIIRFTLVAMRRTAASVLRTSEDEQRQHVGRLMLHVAEPVCVHPHLRALERYSTT